MGDDDFTFRERIFLVGDRLIVTHESSSARCGSSSASMELWGYVCFCFQSSSPRCRQIVQAGANEFCINIRPAAVFEIGM